MNVLIVKISALGDVIHALPTLAYIRDADPNARIEWLVESAFAPLLQDHPLVDAVHTVDTKSCRRARDFPKAITHVMSRVRALRERSFDATLDLQGNTKSALFTGLSRAPIRVGFDRESVREPLNLLATNNKVRIGQEHFHISTRVLRLAEAAFPDGPKNIPLTGPLPITAEAEKAIEPWLNNRDLQHTPFIVLHCGGTWETKLLPETTWKKLARSLSDAGWHLVLTAGNAEERRLSGTITRAVPRKAHIAPQTTLPQLAALLSKAGAVIGGDTGPVHMAAAVGTPTVSYFRASDPARNAPTGENHIYLQSTMECAPCWKRDCEWNDDCRDTISPEAFITALQQVTGT